METKSNLDKLNQLASKERSGWHGKAKARVSNKGWRAHSFKFALRILRILRTRNISQKQLAETMNVSPQYVNKILKGAENISFETVSKFEEALGTSLMIIESPESYYVMRVSSNSSELDFAIRGQKAEPTYLASLKNRPQIPPLFVKANEFGTTEPMSDLNVCSQ